MKEVDGKQNKASGTVIESIATLKKATASPYGCGQELKQRAGQYYRQFEEYRNFQRILWKDYDTLMTITRDLPSLVEKLDYFDD